MSVTETNLERLRRELGVALVNRDADGVARAVGALACEAGPSSLARRTGLSREGFHHLQRRGGNPRMDTLFRTFKELDIAISLADA